MKTKYIALWVCAVSLGLVGPNLRAGEGGIKFKFPVGLAYSAGADDVLDAVEASLQDNGYNITDDFVWPIGLTFNPRIEFPFGLGVGVTVGPTQFLVVERYGSSWEDDDLNYIIPVGGYLQYTILRDKGVSPFVRAGVRYPIVGGDFFDSGSVGPFVSGGVEFYRNKRVGFGVEAGYDWCEISVQAGSRGGEREVKPIGFNVSVFALF